ncbi:MAG: iron-containing alcohol dehydrogenase [Candidatus Saganbacteria bacterium]|nr:iron-containing alcohol dehydrogenase [Candidatus Saganbacteria bacterium]
MIKSGISGFFSISRNGLVSIPQQIRSKLIFPKRVIFKPGAINKIGDEIERLPHLKKGLLVTGKKAMKRGGIPQTLAAALKDKGIETILFDQIESNPDVLSVEEGRKILRRNGCDFVIGLGGGSVLDAAKMIAFLANKDDSPLDYLDGKEAVEAGIPYIAITTTGTGSEVTNNLNLVSRELGKKGTVRSPLLVPDLALVDSELTHSLPRNFTIAVGVDGLVAPLEAYVGKKATPLTDEFAFEAIRLVIENIKLVANDGNDAVAREGMALASLLGAISFVNSALGAVHGLALPFGTHFNLIHGEICGTFLPLIMEYNLPISYKKYEQVAKFMGVESQGRDSFAVALEGIERIKSLLLELGIPLSLRALVGDRLIEENDIEQILDNVGGTSILNNPNPPDSAPSREDQYRIIQAGM